MADQIQQPTAGNTLSSLLGQVQFERHVEGLTPIEQLNFCQSIFQSSSHVEQLSHQRVYQAWSHIEEKKLWLYTDKTQQEYWEYVVDQYEIETIVDTERRKQNYRRRIQEKWRDTPENCLGTQFQSNPSKNLLRQLAELAELCDDVPAAVELLQKGMAARVARSRKTLHIIATDVGRAIEGFRSRQKQEIARRRREEHASNQAKKAAISGKQPTIRPATKKKRPKKPRARKSRARKSRARKSPPPKDPSIDEASDDNSSELSDCRSSLFYDSDDETGVEDEAYTQILNQALPYSTQDFRKELSKEMERLQEEVPDGLWGTIYVKQIRRILMTAKPVTVYVPDVPEGVRHGLHITSSRQNADVLSLTDDLASEALAEGPSDGKPVLIRNSNDRRDVRPQEFLAAIKRYRISDLDVQDPTILSTESRSSRKMSPAELTSKFDEVLDGTKTVGYTDDKIPPFNCLSLPSMSANNPRCLTRTNALRLDHFLRTWNSSTNPVDQLSWSTLALHLAISLSHQDHDGKGTLSEPVFGYKVWLFWPRMTDIHRSRFLEEGMSFTGSGARFLILAPGDQYIQTPCVSQDVHSVISLGYCGVSTCTGDCLKNDHPQCCGLIGVHGTHYRHAHYIADSVNSARDELESALISNEEPDSNFEEWLEQIEELAERDDSLLGGPQAFVQFREAQQHYIRISER